MDLFQRWCLLAIVTIINIELFDPKDWQFWVIAFVIGMTCAPLFSKKAKE